VPPAPAVAAVRRAVRECLDGIELGERRLLVACSGGADSLALAAAVAFLAPRAGLAAGLITVDHGLRADSAEQATRVAALAGELGFDPVLVVPVQVDATGGPEAAARTARYAALHAAAQALDAVVLLGHTLDDQAETVLLGLGRGSGPRSITGMRQADGRYLRPLLGLRRATTLEACRALGLQPHADPHNADPRFQRVRLRHEVLPLLEDVLQGGVAGALARTADLLRDDLDALDAWAAAALAGQHGPDLDVAELDQLPKAVRTRLLRTWLAAAGAGALTAEHTAAVDALVTGWHGQGPADLPGGVAVVRRSARLVVQPSSPATGERATAERVAGARPERATTGGS
jgi:tRNA(Ile)-lysidine synthase